MLSPEDMWCGRCAGKGAVLVERMGGQLKRLEEHHESTVMVAGGLGRSGVKLEQRCFISFDGCFVTSRYGGNCSM